MGAIRKRTFVAATLLFTYVLIFYILHSSMMFSKEDDKDIVLELHHSNNDEDSQTPVVRPQPQGTEEQPQLQSAPPSNEQQQQEHISADGDQTKQQQCDPNAVNHNVDPNHTQAHLAFWRSLDSDTIDAYRENWKDFMLNELPANPEYEHKRGIVLVAGNSDTFERALTAVKMLRRYDCPLPVEVWHLHDESPSNATVQALNELGAVPHDLSGQALPRPVQHRRNAEKQFQIKAAAVINAHFEQVLYLDSDNIPTRDPSFLFETSAFKATGAMFWPDFWKTHIENKIFDILNVPCNDEWEQESGQMVLDKARSWLPLQLAWYMQEHSDLYFQFLNGDKDTFKFAWKALRVPYYMTETFLGMGGLELEQFCGHTMLQYSDEDETHPLFVHANLMKITDKAGFMEGSFEEGFHERPWRQIKRYVESRRKTNLSPAFHIAPGGKACMNFVSRFGEPDMVVEEFDDVLDGFQNAYFELGGIGGERMDKTKIEAATTSRTAFIL
ncbi:mannosyltransferase putative-domain-containing protein [Zychaea mexicana]|uniref:mannosyltransferase putative-domain-containing protein n=1 Tax=Zychaea mexicana TaxID=64656 RepID=UPI0022FE2148|nr:mannosyltransferase putative-domain-containing protein [Zychaea mexicana]KAI9484767.1 mannosyltransferase putative-domain-containing protein [Zychaea mexicana]